MVDLSTRLKYYQRKDIQKELVFNAQNRELGVRYSKGWFGKRPDILQNEADVLELAKQDVSSFHISEEHWKNPLALSQHLKKKDLDKMRAGWDLIIDIDCPDWELSKRIAFVVVKILKKHGISSISCKFSGNKGFHIGVPFKAFPKEVLGKPISLLFPDGVKRVMDYIVHYAHKHHSSEILKGLNIKKLSERIGIKESELVKQKCSKCGTQINEKKKAKIFDYACEKCGKTIRKEEFVEFINCPGCKSIIKGIKTKDEKKCSFCSGISFRTEIDLGLVLGLDKILISSRHLYRMPYSLHEKSGLVSLPINPFSVLAFNKEEAKPETVCVKTRFFDEMEIKQGEAHDLIFKAIEYKPEVEMDRGYENNPQFKRNFDLDDAQEKVPIELFPPCILNMLNGVKDGKKRSLFILTNFLTSLGWDYPDIEILLEAWNKKNEDGLRETNIKGQIKYHQQNKKKVLPPNCSNKIYYADIGVCRPDGLCGRIKNPVNYAKKKAYFLNQQNKKKKKPKNDNTEKNMKGNADDNTKNNIKDNTNSNIKNHEGSNIKGNIKDNVNDNTKNNIKDNLKDCMKDNIKDKVDDNTKGNMKVNIKNNIKKNVEDIGNDNTKGDKQKIPKQEAEK